MRKTQNWRRYMMKPRTKQFAKKSLCLWTARIRDRRWSWTKDDLQAEDQAERYQPVDHGQRDLRELDERT